MKNPFDILTEKLPARSIEVVALRRPGTPIIIRCCLPGDSRFKRREDFEPATGDAVARFAESTRDEMLRIETPWNSFEQLEEWIENAAWAQGAWDMLRLSHPRDPAPDSWMERPGNGIGVAFGGLDSVYSLPGSTGVPAPENHELGDIAAREGWWSWSWKPTAGWAPNSIQSKIARRGDPSILPDGSRALPFPGWLCGRRFAGRSGEWWLGLMKSFEVSDDPGTAIRCLWDFRTRTFNPRA